MDRSYTCCADSLVLLQAVLRGEVPEELQAPELLAPEDGP